MEGKLTPTVVQTISSHNGDVLWVAFAGPLLAVASSDKLVRLFALDNGGQKGMAELPQSPLCAHSYAVNCCHFTSLGNLLASCSQDGRAIIWNVKNGKKTGELMHEQNMSLRVCQFSPDGRMLATGSDDETAVLWDASTLKILRCLEGHESSVVTLAFTPDGHYLCTGNSLGDLRFWDGRFGHGRHKAIVKEAHDLGVTCMAFSPTHGDHSPRVDGSGPWAYLLATGGTDNLVKLWRVSVGLDEEMVVSEYTTLDAHTQNVMSVAFSPSGSLLASASGDKTVIIWDPMKGEELQKLEHHERYVTCCAFSSDGSLLASGSNDKSVAIWSLYGVTGADLIDLEDKGLERKEVKEGKPVTRWNQEDVVLWLESLGLSEYKDRFETNLIDGQELLHLNDTMLKNSLQIDALGHRNRILRGVKELRDGYNLGTESPLGNKTDLPHEYYCPITHELMTDPAIAADGYTYERSAIMAWIENGKRSSPMTNAPLMHLDVTSNRMLKMLIQKNVRM